MADSTLPHRPGIGKAAEDEEKINKVYRELVKARKPEDDDETFIKRCMRETLVRSQSPLPSSSPPPGRTHTAPRRRLQSNQLVPSTAPEHSSQAEAGAAEELLEISRWYDEEYTTHEVD